jgi:hypothetical protein
MHRVVRHLEKVYFGYDTNRFYLRMDFDGGLTKLPPLASVQVHFLGPKECKLVIDRSSGSWGVASFSAPVPAPAVAGGRILEIGMPLSSLGVEGPEEIRFFTVLAENDRELERFPSTGFLGVPVIPSGLNEQEWMV